MEHALWECGEIEKDRIKAREWVRKPGISGIYLTPGANSPTEALEWWLSKERNAYEKRIFGEYARRTMKAYWDCTREQKEQLEEMLVEKAAQERVRKRDEAAGGASARNPNRGERSQTQSQDQSQNPRRSKRKPCPKIIKNM
jgi:hypothetical protein